MLTFVISSLITSNFPWFMDWTHQIPMQYCFYSIGLFFHHQTHPQLGFVSTLAQPLHSFWSYFSTLLWQHIGHLQIGEFIFQCHIFLPFHTSHVVLKARMLKCFATSVHQIWSELFTMTCLSWVALHSMAHHSFELDKAVIHVISLVSFLWLWFSFSLPSDG